jgi:feruloyl esterase
MKRLLAGVTFALAFAAVSAHAAAPECAELVSFKTSAARIVAATSIVPAPVWQTPPAATAGDRLLDVKTRFCRVEGVIEKEIAFELWLPEKPAWNGRFMGTGNGGDAGFINYQDLMHGVGRGFATASTDSGHKRSEARWAQGRPDRVENYGHRAQHLLAVHAKQIVDRYYGMAPTRSYFVGCSGGGAMGLQQAQYHPEDYDGILSGAAGIGMLPLATRILTSALFVQKNPQYALSAEQYLKVADTVVAACDANDGVTDGVVDEPYACKFDPATVSGLSSEQIKMVRMAYSPLRDEKGAQIDPGFAPGSPFRPNARQIDTAKLLFGDWAYQDPNWDVDTLVLSRELPAAEKKLPFLRFSNPDLTGLRQRGAKLITYQGWVDNIVPAGLTVQFNRSVVSKLGEAETAKFFRLFMAPGMDHCRGGPGPESFGQAFRGPAPVADADHDLLLALMRWVEQGKAPDRIIASREKNGVVDRTRPLCPYPQRAVYRGSGSTDDAASFECRLDERQSP